MRLQAELPPQLSLLLRIIMVLWIETCGQVDPSQVHTRAQMDTRQDEKHTRT